MNCDKFEEHISSFLDGDLNQSLRSDFTEHMKACSDCNGKVSDMRTLLHRMQQLKPLRVSAEFDAGLAEKLAKAENSGEGLIVRLRNWRPFGMKPVSAFTFSTAVAAALVATFFVLQSDELPAVDFNQLQQNVVAERSTQHAPGMPMGMPQAVPQTMPNQSTMLAAQPKDSSGINWDSLRYNPNTPPIHRVNRQGN